ncbi:S8 family serine peptidase [Streptomyces sp. CBMA156]|uniref:S8 family serine peptidase n=1 Tax=Streptomyces sp. CBMA156 TaxID=1930280 RepID=UPI001661C413|nr:S8 family serine peptidase [Streptomyces sp. CBMA156]MBD0674615.1 peptidase S08 family protein [Streptomyces sp. CBMA156]
MAQAHPSGGPARRRRVRGPARALLAMLLTALVVGGAVPYVSGTGRAYLSYLVLAEGEDAAGADLAGAASRAAGGQVVQEYPQIGAALVYAAGGFADRVRARPGIAAVGATRTAPVVAPPRVVAGAGDFTVGAGRGGGGEAGGGGGGGDRADGETTTVVDPGENGAWNLAMVGGVGVRAGDGSTVSAGVAPGAEALHRVLVAVLDSGVDDTHPDLRAAVDPKASVSCADGRPDARTGAWRPDPGVGESGHGTHVAGIVGAARDGHGVAGVAPGVRIAAVRLLGPLGQYYAENIVCGMLWAADHGARAINNSYFADPWKYNCPDDRDQAALIAAVGRATGYAQRKGAVVVASAGNDGQDLGAPRTDERSPNDRVSGAARVRHLGTECVRLPGELPGVVTVTAVNRDGHPAGYSNYGRGRVSLAAPGGDPDGGPQGAIVSDWPGGQYVALAGTSMAAAHVTGAVAVVAASHPELGAGGLAGVLAGAAVSGCPSGPRVCGERQYFGAGVLWLSGGFREGGVAGAAPGVAAPGAG